MPCCHSQSSASKPFGLASPYGGRRRAVSCQRSPARSAGAALPGGTNQASCSCRGTCRGMLPGHVAALSASSTKRRPVGPRCGMAATMPVSRTSPVCAAAGSVCAMRAAMCAPAEPQPAAAPEKTSRASASGSNAGSQRPCRKRRNNPDAKAAATASAKAAPLHCGGTGKAAST